MPAPDISASFFASALAHRSWSVDAAGLCRLFLVQAGHASWTERGQHAVEITGPALLWLPPPLRGTVQVMAGAQGCSLLVGQDFLHRAAGDPALAVHLRPLLDRMVLAGPEMLAPDLAAVAFVFGALVHETQQTRPAADAMAGLHLTTLLLQLWRCAGAEQASGQRGRGGTTVARFRQLVELHYREGLPIDEFAARLGVTRAHLHDACLRATGRTPLRLVHERLLGEARARLEQTELSVEQVGYGIGFRDPGYFNRFFRRLTGHSPGAYRSAHRRQSAPDRRAALPSFAAWP